MFVDAVHISGHSLAVGPADGGMSVLISSAAFGPGSTRLLAVLPPALPLG